MVVIIIIVGMKVMTIWDMIDGYDVIARRLLCWYSLLSN